MKDYYPPLTEWSIPNGSTLTFQANFSMLADGVAWDLDDDVMSEEYEVYVSYYSVNLPAGEYQITVFAHNNSGGVDMLQWQLQVTEGTFMNMTEVQDVVHQGSLNVFGSHAVIVAMVFAFLFALCHAGKLPANASLIIVIPTLIGFTESSLTWFPLWVKAIFVIGMTFIVWLMLWRLVER